MRRMLSALTIALVLTAITAAADGTATGTFTVKGKATNITHAYAMSMPNPMDKTKAAIRLILSDVALTPQVLDDKTPTALEEMTRAGKLHAIEALITVDDKAVIATMLHDAGFKMNSVSVAGTNIKLDVKTLDKTTFAGKLYTAKPDDFNDVPFEYAVTFSAPLTAK